MKDLILFSKIFNHLMKSAPMEKDNTVGCDIYDIEGINMFIEDRRSRVNRFFKSLVNVNLNFNTNKAHSTMIGEKITGRKVTGIESMCVSLKMIRHIYEILINNKKALKKEVGGDAYNYLI